MATSPHKVRGSLAACSTDGGTHEKICSRAAATQTNYLVTWAICATATATTRKDWGVTVIRTASVPKSFW